MLFRSRLPDAAERRPDALDPGFHCARTRWIRGFMTFQLARRTRSVMLMVPVCPESRFLRRAARPRPASQTALSLSEMKRGIHSVSGWRAADFLVLAPELVVL